MNTSSLDTDGVPSCGAPLNSTSYVNSAFSTHPRNGKLIPLRTKAEVSAKLTLIDAYVVPLLPKAAHAALKAFDQAIPSIAPYTLQHLRRFAKYDALSPAIQTEVKSSLLATSGNNTSEDQLQSHLFLLVCPTSLVDSASLASLASLILSPTSTTASLPAPYFVVPVPSTPPTSIIEANDWTSKYWPVVYKAHNPFGPQPAAISLASAAISPTCGTWMNLAILIGSQCHDAGLGYGFGAVIVDPNAEGGPAAVAVAGDARFAGLSTEERESGVSVDGNPLCHAAMRAIALVAKKRVALASEAASESTPAPQRRSAFNDFPLTPSEFSIHSSSPLKPGGYLCSGLDIYLTHEPCVMCCMALLHSRFEHVVFANRMQTTGGLCAEGSQLGGEDMESGSGKGREIEGYGLFWRPELNWKMLVWQWVDDEDMTKVEVEQKALAEDKVTSEARTVVSRLEIRSSSSNGPSTQTLKGGTLLSRYGDDNTNV